MRKPFKLIIIPIFLAALAVTSIRSQEAQPTAVAMPGLDDNEAKLLFVAPGQSIHFEVEMKPGKQQGIAIWLHKEEKMLAFWSNTPINKNAKVDDHGGPVKPTIGGKGGSFTWKNETDHLVIILAHSWTDNINNYSKLRLLVGDGDTNEFHLGGGDNNKYNQIYLIVQYRNQ